MPAADAGTFAWDDLAERRQVATQGVGIFVVDFAHVDLTEVTRARNFLGVARRVHRRVKSVDRKDNERLRGMNVKNEIKREYLRCGFLDHRRLCPNHRHLEQQRSRSMKLLGWKATKEMTLSGLLVRRLASHHDPT